MKFRKINKIDTAVFILDLQSIVSGSSANKQILIISKQLDSYAPIEEKTVTIRQSLTWYDENANILERKV